MTTGKATVLAYISRPLRRSVSQDYFALDAENQKKRPHPVFRPVEIAGWRQDIS
jgi:hypothetical protein